jgi:hypothetical protein
MLYASTLAIAERHYAAPAKVLFALQDDAWFSLTHAHVDSGFDGSS